VNLCLPKISLAINSTVPVPVSRSATIGTDIDKHVFLISRRLCGFVGQKGRKKIPTKLHLLLYKRFHLFQHSRLNEPDTVLRSATTGGYLIGTGTDIDSNIFS
jgi:hypothetical protein